MEKRIHHSNTYTVLDSNKLKEATFNKYKDDLFGKDADQGVIQEAIKIVQQVVLSPEDIERLIQACAMIDGDNEKSTLVILLRMLQHT